MTLWDQLLEGRLAPELFLQTALESLPIERDELVVSRMLAYVSSVYWKYLSPADRIAWSNDFEDILWSQVLSDRSRSGRASFYSAYRSLAISSKGLQRLQSLWAGEESEEDRMVVDELPLSELDQRARAERHSECRRIAFTTGRAHRKPRPARPVPLCTGFSLCRPGS